jgi:hypothetical protein
MEAGYRCANPVCNHVLTLEIHHMVWVKDGGGNSPENLLALCPNCHSLHTQGHIPAPAIRYWKQMLIALNHAFDMRSRDLLLFLRDCERDQFNRPYTSDGVVAFAPLIATGLADARFRQGGFGPGMPPHAIFEVRLTDRGRALLEAWETGDDAPYRRLLERG